ncbi:MAG TPA: DUF481 domain-containing protein [Thermoanaerobaculia bacterium]|nr:DUF481 domain-containing protein [Thermoanaerobaculia bacterium]
MAQVASPPRESSIKASRLRKRVKSEACDNELGFGLLVATGQTSELSSNERAKLCRDSEWTRWTFDGQSTIFRDEKKLLISRNLKTDYDYYFGSRYLATVFASDEANSNYGVSNRVVTAPGIGIYETPDWGYYNFVAGVTNTREKLTDEPHATFAELWAGSELNWSNEKRGLELEELIDFFDRISNLRDNRWQSSTELSFAITDRVALKNSLDFRWRNVPPPRRTRTSLNLEMTLVFKLKRRSR